MCRYFFILFFLNIILTMFLFLLTLATKKSMEQFDIQKSWLLRGSRDMRTVPLKKPEIPIKNHNPLVLVKKKKNSQRIRFAVKFRSDLESYLKFILFR